MALIIMIVVAFIVVVLVTMLFTGPLQRGLGIAGNVVFVSITVKTIDMECESTCTTLNTACPCALASIVGSSDLQVRRHSLWYVVGNSTRVNVNNPADSTAAVKQGAWSFQYFNRLSSKWLNRRDVVGTGYRHIKAIDSVFHDFYPRTT